MNRVVRRVFAAAMAAVLCQAGCNEADWDWFGLKDNSTQPNRRTTAQRTEPKASPAKPSAQPRPAQARAEDPKAKEVDERVTQYVQDMNARYDSSYQGNDLNSKIKRQSDPERPHRIRQTVAKARNNSDPYQPEWAPASRTDASQDASLDADPLLYPAPQSAQTREPGQSSRLPRDELEPEPAPAQPVKAQPPVSMTADRADRNEPADEPSTSAWKDVTPVEPESDLRKAARAESSMPSTDASSSSATSEANTKGDPAAGRTASREGGQSSARPPVLSEVTVEPVRSEPSMSELSDAGDQSEFESSAASNTPAAPMNADRITANAPPAVKTVEIDPIEARIAEQAGLVAKDPNNLEEQFRLRLLYMVAGQDDKALAATPGVNEDIQKIMTGQIQALMSARSTSERDPATWANRQLDAVEQLRALVRARADLRVPRVELCSSIEGFGRYEPIVPAQFMVGGKNLIVLYIEVDNFHCEKTESGMYRTLLSVRLSLLSASGGEELWSKRDENIEDLARQRRTDFYLTIGPLGIPKTLAPGEYVLKVEVEDVLAGKVNGNSVKFKMVP